MADKKKSLKCGVCDKKGPAPNRCMDCGKSCCAKCTGKCPECEEVTCRACMNDDSHTCPDDEKDIDDLDDEEIEDLDDLDDDEDLDDLDDLDDDLMADEDL